MRLRECLALSPVVLLVVHGCSDDEQFADTVTTRADPAADFTQYTTFSFVTEDLVPPDQALPRELPELVAQNAAIINSEVREELIRLGLTEVTEADQTPDLFAFNLAATEEEDTVVWECVPGYWWGWWA